MAAPALIPASPRTGEQLRHREWKSGPLPSVKALQHDYGVGRDTVPHAPQLLRDGGLIFTVAKRGSYVAPH